MGPPEDLWEGVSAADMKKHYLWKHEKYWADRLKEAMLAWVKSVPIAHCSFIAIGKIAERRFTDLTVCILAKATPDERLRIWSGMSPITIPTPTNCVQWALREAKSPILGQAARWSPFIPSSTNSCSMCCFY